MSNVRHWKMVDSAASPLACSAIPAIFCLALHCSGDAHSIAMAKNGENKKKEEYNYRNDFVGALIVRSGEFVLRWR